MSKKSELQKEGYSAKGSYETPVGVSFGKSDLKAEEEGCKHGNQITGDCTTGGYPEGSPADCKNGAHADDPSSNCENGSNPA